MSLDTVEYWLHSVDTTWDYARWAQLPADGNRYEVIDGILYMTTPRSFWHQSTGAGLIEHLVAPWFDSGRLVPVIGPVGVVFPNGNILQPDLVIVRTERRIMFANDYIRDVPDLIAEILSPIHPEIDTIIKRAAFARAGLREYWMVRPRSRDVLVLSEPDATISEYHRSQLFVTGDELVSPTLPIRVPVASLFEPLGRRSAYISISPGHPYFPPDTSMPETGAPTA